MRRGQALALPLATSVAVIALLAWASPSVHAGARDDDAGIDAPPSKDGPRLSPATPRTRPLPPGLWFGDGHYESRALPNELPTPRFAVVVAITTSARAAELAGGRAYASGVLDAGYPWIVTTRDLALEREAPDRIAVVAGLFTDRSAADALAARVTHGRVLALSSTGFDPVWGSDGSEERLFVVAIDPRRDAQGFSRAALEAIERRLDDVSFPSEDARREALEAAIAALPRCMVRRGSIYATRASERYYLSERRWAPARCEGREAVVPVEATLREAVFEYLPSETRVHQVTAVSCDSPNLDVWRWTSEGREVIEGEEPVFAAGCGGRS
ncbi:MAG: hypothetical protein K1X94_18985 [Sandaracinaceae bacterium]|nr:hypothetical protein [Sandaracinaceae bacterium]